MDAGTRSGLARLGISLAASLATMYTLAFSQIEGVIHVRPSLSVLWISLSMVSAMGLIMLATMGKMVPDPKLRLALAAGFAAVLVGAFVAGRTEALVGDDAFLRSMIPHHSRAIHMCHEASLQDAQVQDLCRRIVEAQRAEIAEMDAIIARRGAGD